MSWANFQKEAYDLTRLETLRFSREIKKEYRLAILNISAELDRIYARILSGVKPENYFIEMQKFNRLNSSLERLIEEYKLRVSKIELFIRRILGISFSNTYYRKLYATQWLSPDLKTFVLPKELIELTVLGTDKAFKEIGKAIQEKFGNKTKYMPQRGSLSSLLAANSRKDIAAIRSAITQSLVNGLSKNETLKRIQDLIGKETKKDGITKITGSRASAERILRTETNRVRNMGAYAQSKYAASQGVEIKRRLTAVLDSRTRRQSASMNGQTVGIDEPFTYPNGAKALTPGTTGFAKYDVNDRETVFDIIEDQGLAIRRGISPVSGREEKFTFREFDKWLKENDLRKNKSGMIVPKK